MFIQKSKPKAGDPFFNNKAAGGISTCITGKPTDSGCNVLANCVGGAVGAFNKAACADLSKPTWWPILYPPNAENLFKYCQQMGLKTSHKPYVGALIIWQKGKTLTASDGAGHVAFVTAVKANGDIETAESEYGGRAWVNRSYKAPNYTYGSNYTFLGFVLQPETKEESPKETITHVLKLGDKGADVELMQARLHALGYLRKNEIDGDFGRITLGAVCAFQLQHNLEVDGICGPKTRAALLDEV